MRFTTAAVVAATASTAAAQKCAGLELVYARATTEPPTGIGAQSTAQDFETAAEKVWSKGYGAAGFSLLTNVTALLPEALGYPVHYPANWQGNISAPTGVSDMVNHIAKVAKDCPKTLFALGGHSQGSSVTVQAIPKIPKELLSRVVAVTMFGGRPCPKEVEGKCKSYCNEGDGCMGGGKGKGAKGGKGGMPGMGGDAMAKMPKMPKDSSSAPPPSSSDPSSDPKVPKDPSGSLVPKSGLPPPYPKDPAGLPGGLPVDPLMQGPGPKVPKSPTGDMPVTGGNEGTAAAKGPMAGQPKAGQGAMDAPPPKEVVPPKGPLDPLSQKGSVSPKAVVPPPGLPPVVNPADVVPPPAVSPAASKGPASRLLLRRQAKDTKGLSCSGPEPQEKGHVPITVKGESAHTVYNKDGFYVQAAACYIYNKYKEATQRNPQP